MSGIKLAPGPSLFDLDSNFFEEIFTLPNFGEGPITKNIPSVTRSEKEVNEKRKENTFPKLNGVNVEPIREVQDTFPSRVTESTLRVQEPFTSKKDQVMLEKESSQSEVDKNGIEPQKSMPHTTLKRKTLIGRGISSKTSPYLLNTTHEEKRLPRLSKKSPEREKNEYEQNENSSPRDEDRKHSEFIESTSAIMRKVEEMNSFLLESEEQLKELSVKLYCLSAELLPLSDPSVGAHIDKIVAKTQLLFDEE